MPFSREYLAKVGVPLCPCLGIEEGTCAWDECDDPDTGEKTILGWWANCQLIELCPPSEIQGHAKSEQEREKKLREWRLWILQRTNPKVAEELGFLRDPFERC